MSFIVSCIDDVSMDQIRHSASVCVDDWTAESVIIASNEIKNRLETLFQNFDTHQMEEENQYIFSELKNPIYTITDF